MRRNYFTHEEEEANREGHRDQQRGSVNHAYSKFSDEAADQAYWQGKRDEERKMERRRAEESRE